MTNAFRHAAIALVATGAIALSGCGKSDSVVAENESAEDVAAKVSKMDVKPSPGRWESKISIEKIEIPGLPAEVQDMMKSQMGKVQTSITCLTQEELDKNEGEFFKPGNQSGCTYNKFAMGGGKIDADMTCAEGPMKQNMKMSGTYSAEAYTMKIDADGQMDGKEMSMAMSVDSKRVGECDGSEQG